MQKQQLLLVILVIFFAHSFFAQELYFGEDVQEYGAEEDYESSLFESEYNSEDAEVQGRITSLVGYSYACQNQNGISTWTCRGVNSNFPTVQRHGTGIWTTNACGAGQEIVDYRCARSCSSNPSVSKSAKWRIDPNQRRCINYITACPSNTRFDSDERMCRTSEVYGCKIGKWVYPGKCVTERVQGCAYGSQEYNGKCIVDAKCPPGAMPLTNSDKCVAGYTPLQYYFKSATGSFDDYRRCRSYNENLNTPSQHVFECFSSPYDRRIVARKVQPFESVVPTCYYAAKFLACAKDCKGLNPESETCDMIVPRVCPAGYTLNHMLCEKDYDKVCPPRTNLQGSVCVTNPAKVCENNYTQKNGACYFTPSCPPNMSLVGSECHAYVPF